MIFLEFFFAIFIIMLLVFGKIEIQKKSGLFRLKLSLIIKGRTYPLLTINREPPEQSQKSEDKPNISL